MIVWQVYGICQCNDKCAFSKSKFRFGSIYSTLSRFQPAENVQRRLTFHDTLSSVVSKFIANCLDIFVLWASSPILFHINILWSRICKTHYPFCACSGIIEIHWQNIKSLGGMGTKLLILYIYTTSYYTLLWSICLNVCLLPLTHLPLVPHIYIDVLGSNGSDNGFRLFSSKPLSKPMLDYCRLNS